MKKILYIIAATMLALTACTKEMPWNNEAVPEGQDSVYPEGAQVDLVFSIPDAPRTKGDMADSPAGEIDNLYVAIFDGSGSLKEYVQARPLNGWVTGNGIQNAKRFRARVTLKNAERRLHFIANAPVESITSGMESALLQQWQTTYPNAAYWQRIVLPNGITAYTFSKNKSDGSTWLAGQTINFWYYTEEEEGKTVYYPAPEGSQEEGVTLQPYTIKYENGHPCYVDLNKLTVNPGDFLDARGCKITDGTGYFQSEEVAQAVEKVPMVRNFARIKIIPKQVAPTTGETGETTTTGDEVNFVPQEFYLMNIPDRGTIAPYSANVGGFVPEYTSKSSYDDDGKLVVTDPAVAKLEAKEITYEDFLSSLNGSKYTAAMPVGGRLIQTPTEVKNNNNQIPTTWQKYNVSTSMENLYEDGAAAFLFERGMPDKNNDPTYLLVGGKLDGYNEPRWFKIELIDDVGKYFRIFRDVTYVLEISYIEGTDGYGSAAEAALGTPVSDISNAIATENLLQINDGKGTTMVVNYIDKVGTSPNVESFDILYRVYNNSGSLSPTWDDDADPDTPEVPRYTLSFTDETTGAILVDDSHPAPKDGALSGNGPDGQPGWRTATVWLKEPNSAKILKSTLTISAVTDYGSTSGSGKTLSRNVKYNKMNKQKLALSTTPLTNGKAANQKTTLTIELPEGLSFSMFPLVLQIEAEKGNFVPSTEDNDGIDLPVSYGKSYFGSQNSFYFLYTLEWSDYYDRTLNPPYKTKKELTFVTSKAFDNTTTASNETYFAVTDKDHEGYFVNYPEDPSIDIHDTVNNKAVTKVTVGTGN